MGAIWGVHPFDVKSKGIAEEEGTPTDYPVQGNRLPTVGEIRAALNSIEGLRFKEYWAHSGGRWQASIETEHDSTLMNVVGVSGDSSPPKDIYLEKGFAETVAEILEHFATTCGYLFVTKDSDNSFFIIGPGVDPYEFIDGGEEDDDEEDG